MCPTTLEGATITGVPFDPADERRHDDAPPTGEEWTFEFSTADASLGGWVRYTQLGDVAKYHAMVTGARRQLVAVLDDDVPLRSNPMEVRTTGLWADHVCETAFDHWTVGLEAFGLGVDDPLEIYGRQLGDRVPLGLDVEWETDGPVLELGATAYAVPCRVTGEVLLGTEAVELDAVGWRDHDWGVPARGWTVRGSVEAAEHVHGAATDAGGELARLADDVVSRSVAVGGLDTDPNGLPVAAGLRADVALEADVVAVTPVVRAGLPGRGRRPRALARLRLRDGGDVRAGVGWVEDRPHEVGQVDARR